MTTSAVFTTLYRERLADAALTALSAVDSLQLSYVKYGCAGRFPGSAMPPASLAFSDLQALGGAACPLPAGWPTAGGSDPTSVGEHWYYCKVLAPGQVTVAGSVVSIVCRLEAGEANDDGTGTEPSLFELGVFDHEHNLMIYVAHTEAVKHSGVALQSTITLTY
jgi:hypothetical protein